VPGDLHLRPRPGRDVQPRGAPLRCNDLPGRPVNDVPIHHDGRGPAPYSTQAHQAKALQNLTPTLEAERDPRAEETKSERPPDRCAVHWHYSNSW
jgi:hypothetical protein